MESYPVSVMVGVREYGEGDNVELRRLENGRLVIKATNEGGYNSTEVDLEDLLTWVMSHEALVKD